MGYRNHSKTANSGDLTDCLLQAEAPQAPVKAAFETPASRAIWRPADILTPQEFRACGALAIGPEDGVTQPRWAIVPPDLKPGRDLLAAAHRNREPCH